MKLRRLLAVSLLSVLLAVGFARASSIDDCNQSADLDRQIEGCTLFLQLDTFSPHVALAYGRRGEAYVHKGDFVRAIADYRAALVKNPSPSDRKDIESALERFGATP